MSGKKLFEQDKRRFSRNCTKAWLAWRDVISCLPIQVWCDFDCPQHPRISGFEILRRPKELWLDTPKPFDKGNSFIQGSRNEQANDMIISSFYFLGNFSVCVTDEEVISKRKVKSYKFFFLSDTRLRVLREYSASWQKSSANLIISDDEFLGNFSL